MPWLRREVTLSDVQRLTELKFIRISRYDSDKADNEIRQIEEDIKATQYDLDHLTEYAVAYYERIRDKYGKGKERRTELREALGLVARAHRGLDQRAAGVLHELERGQAVEHRVRALAHKALHGLLAARADHLEVTKRGFHRLPISPAYRVQVR